MMTNHAQHNCYMRRARIWHSIQLEVLRGIIRLIFIVWIVALCANFILAGLLNGLHYLVTILVSAHLH